MTFRSLTTGLTERTCECCCQVEDDQAAHLLVEEAVLLLINEQEMKAVRDARAWDDAEQALAEARA